ncbi:MAG: A/G-specific adenine glycosylase [Sphingobacteriales bacterium]|jgi:A/G-specific adenine glycosylase
MLYPQYLLPENRGAKIDLFPKIRNLRTEILWHIYHMIPSKKQIHSLIHWYSTIKRDFPWRKTIDPYLIWLSEIMLQQTRTEQGLPYYNKFTKRFPKVDKLASASEETILKMWEGLGYYSRARNLHKCAKVISHEMQGEFPLSYEGLLDLPGVGPYTAAAIGSFAFENPTPVLDGNVKRVVSRVLSLHSEIESKASKNALMDWLNLAIYHSKASTFNQAMMELGALVCTPRSPNCTECPINAGCSAFQNGNPSQFPIKLKKVKIKEWNLKWSAISTPKGWIMVQNFEGQIWKNLYRFPGELMEGENCLSNELPPLNCLGDLESIGNPFRITHLLSHRKLIIEVLFYRSPFADKLPSGYYYNPHQNLPVPVPVQKALDFISEQFSTPILQQK